jgi:hypothetical protein
LWLGSLWFAAPLLGGRRDDPAGRVRDALILGTAIPFALAFLHLLSGLACGLCLALLVVWRILRKRSSSPERGGRSSSGAAGVGSAGNAAGTFGSNLAIALPVVLVAACAWPQLVRPLLQGDSLGYHLPNAAAWVQAGSLWTTTTRYWWYPGGSELFAAGLFATAGPLALGFAGTGAALLLGLRLSRWGQELGLPGWIAGALAAFALSATTLAEQSGNLENDLWLAAFFIELLWVARYQSGALARTTALTALLKPFGWLYALTAGVASRANVRGMLLGFAPFALWLVRDAILWRGAIIPPASVMYPNTFATTILAHGVEGVTTLAGALYHDGAATLALFLLGLGALIFGGARGFRVAALATLALFLINPYGFNDYHPQLASGASLRYGAPFLALGAVFGITGLARVPRLAPFAGALALAFAALGAAHTYSIYRFDLLAQGTFWIVALVALVMLLPGRLARPYAIGALGLGLVAYACTLSGTHPLDYYDEWLHPPVRTKLFDWLAQNQPAAVVGSGIRTGAIAAVSPSSRVIDALVDDPCQEAREQRALLISSTDDTISPDDVAARRRNARACGTVLYADGAAMIVAPSVAK